MLKVPLTAETLDAHLGRAEKEHLTHLQLLAGLLGEQADRRRERSLERRIRAARFREPCSLEGFDWQFNAKTIDRAQIEQLATCDFVRRGENLVFWGQSGVGKSRLIQSIGRQACVLGYRVRYTTSAELLQELTAALADQSLPRQLRYYANFEVLIIDEFGFDKLERDECSRAASLLFKIIDQRGPKRSTCLVTNLTLNLKAWEEYLNDAPLAMAIFDRLVDSAITLHLTGKSYRAHRARRLDTHRSGTAQG